MKKLLAFILGLIITAAAPLCIAEDALPEFPFPHNAAFGMSPNQVVSSAVARGGVVYDVTKIYPDTTIIVREATTGDDGLNYMLVDKKWLVFDKRICGRTFFFDTDDLLDQFQIGYSNPNPESYALTNAMLIEAYGETPFSVTTGLTLPLPPVTIEEVMSTYGPHPVSFTLLNGQIYDHLYGDYLIVCEAWHQWLIPYGDTFVAVDHVYYRYYKDAETAANETPREYLTFTLLDDTERDYLIETMNEMAGS